MNFLFFEIQFIRNIFGLIYFHLFTYKIKKLLKMKIKHFLLPLPLLATQVACNNAEKIQDKQPNVLVFLIEELDYETITIYGNKINITPNIDNLGEESTIYQNAYCSQPVSGPSRTSILTGLYPHATPNTCNNSFLRKEGDSYKTVKDFDKDMKLVTEFTDRSKYQSCYVGKWHVGPERTHAQKYFDEYHSINDKWREKGEEQFSSYHYWLLEKGLVPDQPDGTYGYKRVVNMAREFSRLTFMDEKATDFLKNRDKTKPFMMFFAPHEVHTPNTGPYNSLISPTQIELDSSYFRYPDENSPLRHRIRAKKWSVNLTAEQKKEELVRYYGKVYDIDKSVGKVIQHLKEIGEYDNTMIIFTADHGSMTNRRGFQTKMMMFNNSSQVPLFIKMPGQKEQIFIEQPTSLVNLSPTILDLWGIEIPASMHGQSWIKQEEKDYIVIEWAPIAKWKWHKFSCDLCEEKISKEELLNVVSQRIRCIVTKDGWKLVLSEKDKDKCQLYNLNNDAMELNNLYYTEKYKEKIIELQNKLLQWQKEHNDTVELTLIK